MGVVKPPVGLALARDEAQVPTPDARWVYEPKFDGWRAVLFTASAVVQSRRNNDLSGRFPEIAAAAGPLGDLVLDGELVALRDGRLDFGSLTSAAHSRQSMGVTIYFVAFDLLGEGRRDWRPRPYWERRARLERLLSGVAPPLQLIPMTTDQREAMQWMNPAVSHVGIEGLLIKDRDRPYRVGRTGDWRKVRQRAVFDAIVVGITGPVTRPEALVLARHDEDGALRPLGLSLPLSPALRNVAAQHIALTGGPSQRLPGGTLGHPGTEYQPVHPTLHVEAEAEPTAIAFNGRLRPRIHRIRTDLASQQSLKKLICIMIFYYVLYMS